jgi:hypothetical protein
MPEVKSGEERSDYMARCVPEIMKEGLTQEQAVGKCEGMFSARKSEESPQDCAVRKALEAPLPEGATVSGTTVKDGTGHVHGYAARGGEGTTSDAGGHRHQVRGWLVMPAEGHTHVLDRVYSGARKEASEHGMEPEEALRTAVEHVSEHPNYYRVLGSVAMCPNSIGDPRLAVEKAGKAIGSTSQRSDGTWKKVGEGDWRKVPAGGAPRPGGLSGMGQPKKYAKPSAQPIHPTSSSRQREEMRSALGLSPKPPKSGAEPVSKPSKSAAQPKDLKMTREEYGKMHRDYKGTHEGKPHALTNENGATVMRPVEFTDSMSEAGEEPKFETEEKLSGYHSKPAD